MNVFAWAGPSRMFRFRAYHAAAWFRKCHKIYVEFAGRRLIAFLLMKSLAAVPETVPADTNRAGMKPDTDL